MRGWGPREGLDHEMEPQEWDEHPYEKRAERNAVFVSLALPPSAL